ncbi:FKBP-type peptidyl-prolyl cis-trans isomerase [Nitrincola tibetensis]|uniref:Peptidyl-prolyl cis-trans isomerase n=1 Tax=Nitrincola tibetensis TaxID=2219697 RepID=A0A364NIL8_9GAMM|nr:FKBP-type peptidyl-prolyl cis-trans isomerase [Nitrincola tibetensis]RAU16894.1 FKBP-type peptidyl-prolyl cis-trans isomerase [Nitrincola tibetensis]
MKTLTLAVALTGTLLSAAVVQAQTLTSENEKLSYGLGLILGENLLQDFDQLDIDAFRRGVETVYSQGEPLMTPQEVGEVMQAYQEQRMEEQRAMFTRLSEDNLKKGEDYLAENGKRSGVVTTDSGLQYETIEAGEGASPSAADTVKVHYRGELIDGAEFDSSYARGEPVSFPLNGVIPGWTEGLQLMQPGGKARLVIPAKLAYGPGGMGNAIGPNETLIFEVELLEVNPE